MMCVIFCCSEVLKKAWNDGKGIHFNMTSMGLSADANMTLAPANAKVKILQSVGVKLLSIAFKA